MSVVHIIDTLTEWARENVCNKIKLKVPPLDGAFDDAGYQYKLVNPAAFGMYLPTSEKLPPNIHNPFPSVCVGFSKGQDVLAENAASLNVQLSFATWDTGIHGKDIYGKINYNEYQQWSGTEADAYFRRSGEGWRDAWNFVDIALRELESLTHIGGYVIDRSTPIEFGPLAEQEGIPNLYPFWFAWISFRIKYSIVRNDEKIQQYL